MSSINKLIAPANLIYCLIRLSASLPDDSDYVDVKLYSWGEDVPLYDVHLLHYTSALNGTYEHMCHDGVNAAIDWAERKCEDLVVSGRYSYAYRNYNLISALRTRERVETEHNRKLKRRVRI